MCAAAELELEGTMLEVRSMLSELADLRIKLTS
jgi:hypothetical protein